MSTTTEGRSPTPVLRSPVFHCPYCGEEDLRPSEEHRSGWRCQACERVFSVTLHAVQRDPAVPRGEQS